MSFEEALEHPFTDEHQPSLQSRSHSNNNNTIIGGVALREREARAPQSKLVRGVVTC
jgi:hypothetical protein